MDTLDYGIAEVHRHKKLIVVNQNCWWDISKFKQQMFLLHEIGHFVTYADNLYDKEVYAQLWAVSHAERLGMEEVYKCAFELLQIIKEGFR